MATHSSILAWGIPGKEEPGGLPSMGSHRIRHNWSDLTAAAACPLSHWCHPTISSPVLPFLSCLQSFPASGCFPVSQLFAPGGQRIGPSVSASVLSMNIQGWFHLWLVWSPCCPRDSQEFSPALQFKSINSSVLSFLYGPTPTSVHDSWKNHSFDYLDRCWQSDVSAF